MSDPELVSQQKDRKAGQQAAVCLLAVPLIFFLASFWSDPHWNWDTSILGALGLPGIVAAFCGCVAAPFRSSFGRGWQFLLAAAGAVLFAATCGVCFVLYSAFWGNGIR